MKKIKVKPIFGAHQIYQEVSNYPPRGVEYLGLSSETKKGKYYQKKKKREFVNRILNFLKIPRIIFVKPGNYDIIHSSRGIIPLNKKIWVMDIEHVYSFTSLHSQLKDNIFLRKFVEKQLASEYCKAILCHCEATRQGFFKYLNCEKFKGKLKVLYPASHIIHIKKEKHKKIRILAVISLFKQKGGMQILEAFSKLEKKFKNIELWIKSDVPKEIKERYNSKNIKYIEYFGKIISREKLIKDLYSKCDIFLYPTLCDSFGYSLMDGMVAKLPIISTNLFAAPELVSQGKTGFIINIPGYDPKKGIQEYPIRKLTGTSEKKFVNEMVNYLEKLIKNKKMRDNMGREGFKQIKEGKFSIGYRNKKLREIYEKALK